MDTGRSDHQHRQSRAPQLKTFWTVNTNKSLAGSTWPFDTACTELVSTGLDRGVWCCSSMLAWGSFECPGSAAATFSVSSVDILVYRAVSHLVAGLGIGPSEKPRRRSYLFFISLSKAVCKMLALGIGPSYGAFHIPGGSGYALRLIVKRRLVKSGQKTKNQPDLFYEPDSWIPWTNLAILLPLIGVVLLPLICVRATFNFNFFGPAIFLLSSESVLWLK